MIRRAGGLSLALACLAGCGGTGPGSDFLGRNSDVRVVMGVPSTLALEDLELSVAPYRGSFDDSRSCRIGTPNFCFQTDKLPDERVVILGFKTRSDAAINPYYVWVQNKSTKINYPIVIRIFVDGKEQVDETFVVSKDAALQVGKVFRNNAGV